MVNTQRTIEILEVHNLILAENLIHYANEVGKAKSKLRLASFRKKRHLKSNLNDYEIRMEDIRKDIDSNNYVINILQQKKSLARECSKLSNQNSKLIITLQQYIGNREE